MGRAPSRRRRGIDPAVARVRKLALGAGQWPTHPSPPTITLGTAGAASTVPASVAHANGSLGKFDYLGGDWGVVGAVFPDNIYWTFNAVTFTAGSTRTGICGAIETRFHGRYFEPAFQGASSAPGQQWRLIVDGMDCGILPAVTSSTNTYRVLCDFGSTSSAGRLIRLEYVGGNWGCKIWEICTEAGAVLLAPPAPKDDAPMSLDFLAARYRNPAVSGAALQSLTVTQPAARLALSSSGYVAFAANQPRITDLGLTVDAAATNLALHSEAMDNAAWTKSNITVTANAGTSTSGANTADKLAATVTSGTHVIFQGAGTASNGQSRTMQIEVEAAGITSCRLRLAANGQGFQAVFNLATGAITSTGGFSGGPAPSVAAIKPLGGGRYLLTLGGTFGGTFSNLAVQTSFWLMSGTNDTFAGNGTDGINVCRWQVESGLAASTYVASGATNGTRTGDTAVIALPAGAGGDRIEVTYGAGQRVTVLRSALATPNQINLGSDGGAPWLNGQIKRIELVTRITRDILFGDSFFGASGVSNMSQTLAYKLARQLGRRNVHFSGSGGTGWKQAGGSPFFGINGETRWPIDVTAYAPRLVIVMMGGNDMGDGNDAAVQTAAATAIDNLRAAWPDCLIIVFSPWDIGAPGAPEAGFPGIRDALKAAAAGKGRTWFFSLEGVAYTKADGTHADAAGHETLFKAMFNQIAGVFGLARLP